MEFGGYPAQEVKPDPDLVSVLSVNALLQVETLFYEEMGASLRGFTPALSEAVLVIGTPGIQLAKGRQFRMIAEQLDERAIAGRHERKEVISDFSSKGLRSARRPGHVAITPLWKGVELGDGGRDRELRVSRRKIAPIFYLPSSIYLLRHYVLF
jgi:hypothetical protein